MGIIRSDTIDLESDCNGEAGSLVGVAKPSSATGVRPLMQISIGFSASSIDFLLIAGACGIFQYQ